MVIIYHKESVKKLKIMNIALKKLIKMINVKYVKEELGLMMANVILNMSVI